MWDLVTLKKLNEKRTDELRALRKAGDSGTLQEADRRAGLRPDRNTVAREVREDRK